MPGMNIKETAEDHAEIQYVYNIFRFLEATFETKAHEIFEK